MKLDMHRKLLGLGLSGLVFAVAVGIAGEWGVQRMSADLGGVALDTQALRYQLEADMLHDALRADVYAAVLAGDGAQRAKALEAIERDAKMFHHHLAQLAKLPLEAEVRATVERIMPRLQAYVASAREVAALAGKDGEAARAALAGFDRSFYALAERMEALATLIQNGVAARAEAGRRDERAVTWMVLGIGSAALVLGVILSLLLARALTRRIALAVGVAESIARGELDNPIEHRDGGDEIDDLLGALDTMQRELIGRMVEERNAALRLNKALDSVNAAVLVTDQHYDIIYANPAAIEMFRANEAGLRAAGLREFSAERIVGANMDDFHKDPAHQRRLLDALSGDYSSEVRHGELTLKVTANPVLDEHGERIGTVVEWLDRSAEVRVEREVEALVDAAGRGDFTRRIEAAGYQGFFRDLAEQLNALMETAERGLGDVVRVLKALARGDLTERIEADYQGLFGELKDSANATVEKLREVVGQISAAAAEVSRGAAEISQGNASLSGRTEEQASNLEETAAAMEEMTSTVKQNADNARQASQLAEGARSQAEHGGEVAGQAVAAMGAISEASRKIADIISVIDEIAFQTNLLALNASVEAARAGEQGRGFAVVAAEVRNLAGRSATAAKEIKELIADSVGKVEEGSRLVDESGRALEEIMGSVKKVTDVVAEIAAASREQSEGIDQINRAVTQIDEMTQQNAALVEEAASASEAMGAQARRLDELVAFFRTGQGREEVAAAPGAGAVVVERRGKGRPWSGRAAGGGRSAGAAGGAGPEEPAAKPVKAAAAGAEDEWEEF